MTHEIYVKIEAGDKNTSEEFLNSIKKFADKGNVEFGAGIEVERIEAPAETEGFE